MGATLKNTDITHIISTDLNRNVGDIATDLLLRDVYVVDIVRPTNVIFANVPKRFNAKSLKNIKGIKVISPNYPIKAI